VLIWPVHLLVDGGGVRAYELAHRRAGAVGAPGSQELHRLGGSHAQRDLLVLMLIDSALKTGDRALARSIAVERAVPRPHGSPPG